MINASGFRTQFSVHDFLLPVFLLHYTKGRKTFKRAIKHFIYQKNLKFYLHSKNKKIIKVTITKFNYYFRDMNISYQL